MHTESYYTQTVKLSRMDQQYYGRKVDYRVRDLDTDRILAVAATEAEAVAQAEAKLAAEAAATQAVTEAPAMSETEINDRAEYDADEAIREHDSIDDMDDYRPKLYTGATSQKLSSKQVAARRAARRRF